MNKEELEKVVYLLKRREICDSIIMMLIESKDCKLSGNYRNGTKSFSYVLTSEDRLSLQEHFYKTIDDINEELKELKYYD